MNRRALPALPFGARGRLPDGRQTWHKNGGMPHSRRRKERPPLSPQALDEMALRYVGRFATTRARLASYLARKLRERGWSGEREPDLDTLTGRLMRLGYVDDAAYAISKARALTGRGYGERRVRQSLKAAGVGEEEGRPAEELAKEERVRAALKFARRRRIGPYSEAAMDRPAREKGIAAMVRAGHAFGLARAIAEMSPGADVDEQELAELR
jgi:regulatory protein